MKLPLGMGIFHFQKVLPNIPAILDDFPWPDPCICRLYADSDNS